MTPSASKSPTRTPRRHPPDVGRPAAGRLLLDAALALLLAPACAACGAPLDHPSRGPVCARCWAAVVPIEPPVCDGCGDPLAAWQCREPPRCGRCQQGARAITRGRAIGAYEGALRAILHALKYDGRRSLAADLGARLTRSGAAVLAGAGAAVPIPLHRSKRRQRGFNQAEDIARALPLPMMRALVRRRATVSQTDLPAEARRANVRGAFALARGACVRGVVVVLVDDVSTTGATLEACARVLLDAGAREVRALTAARVVSRGQ